MIALLTPSLVVTRNERGDVITSTAPLPEPPRSVGAWLVAWA